MERSRFARRRQKVWYHSSYSLKQKRDANLWGDTQALAAPLGTFSYRIDHKMLGKICSLGCELFLAPLGFILCINSCEPMARPSGMCWGDLSGIPGSSQLPSKGSSGTIAQMCPAVTAAPWFAFPVPGCEHRAAPRQPEPTAEKVTHADFFVGCCIFCSPFVPLEKSTYRSRPSEVRETIVQSCDSHGKKKC